VADDPFAVFGLTPDATESELRAARRRLAMSLHPDRAGGSDAATAAMQRLNEAFERALVRLGRTGEPAAGAGAPAPSGSAASAGRSGRGAGSADVAPPVPRPGGRLAHDVASFTIEALPAEAFEALLIVASWLGDPIDDDPPYRLDVVLGEPFGCWCRLELVPDAGARTVALTRASLDGRPVPDLDAVRDAWVRELNTLGRPED
jgi:hypothetical protein